MRSLVGGKLVGTDTQHQEEVYTYINVLCGSINIHFCISISGPGSRDSLLYPSFSMAAARALTGDVTQDMGRIWDPGLDTGRNKRKIFYQIQFIGPGT